MAKTDSLRKFLQRNCAFVFVCLLSVSGEDNVHRVVVEEGSDAVLPCSLSTKENIVLKLFDWRKVVPSKKEVFMYDAGVHYNNGRPGQDEQFKGRVFHFPDQLKFGNASIKITKAKIGDGGNYTCDFPRLQSPQMFHIELVINAVLKERSGEISGAGRPLITTPDAAPTRSLLRCQVTAASPKPRVEWKDSSGNVLPAHDPQVSERGGVYDIVLDTDVTKTDRYRCVVTQEEIGHQAAAEINVVISDEPSSRVGWLFAGMIIGAAVLAVVQAVLVATKRITINYNKREEPKDEAEKVTL